MSMRRQILKSVLLWLSLAVLLLALAVLTASPWIVSALLCLLLLPVVTFAVNFRLRKDISVSIDLPATGTKHTAAQGTLRVRNGAFLPVLRHYCTLEICNDLTGERETLTLSGGIGAKGETSHGFLLQSEFCGRHTLRLHSMALTDYFGILPVRVHALAEARITVLPELFAAQVSCDALGGCDGEESANRRGSDPSEIFQLRDYRPGDDVRQIHWKLSAKLERPVYREASLPESRSLLLVWDKRSRGTPAQTDALAEAIASVSLGLVQKGIPFCLCWTEDDEPQRADINDETSLLLTLPALVKGAGDEACRLPETAGFARILFFGIRPAAELQDDERVHFVLCGDEMAQKDANVTVFTPENYRQSLERLEV